MDKLRIVSLNVRGMKNKTKRKSLLLHFKNNKYDIICLQESHLTTSDVNLLKREWGGRVYHNEGTSRSRGEVILISKHFKGEVQVEERHERILIVGVQNESFSFFLANIYAPNSSKENILFFQNLTEKLQKYENENLIVTGDFNCSINPEVDIISGNPHDKREVDTLKQTIRTLDLVDMWRIHHPLEKEFTWSRLNPFIARRIDYCFISKNILPYATSCNHSFVANTDHKAVVLDIEDNKFNRGPGYWRFNNSLLKNKTFMEIMNATLETFQKKNELDSVRKWETCKIEIRNTCIDFGKKLACEKKNELITLKMNLQEIEQKLSKDPDDETLLKSYHQIKQKIEVIHTCKTKGAQVRARLKWVEEGEKNTKFFCNLEKLRNSKKIINRLTKESGEVLTNQQEILEEQTAFYKKLYSQQTEATNIEEAVNIFLENEPFQKIDTEEARQCEGNITIEETGAAASKMTNGSAPGSDGLTIEFYKFFWNRIGEMITRSYNDSFMNGELSYTQRQGIITLIHKGKDLERDKLNNWRPITLTNTDYKILAKVLAERLGKVIDKIVSKDQVGYIKGRSIATVIRTIDDAINYLNKTGKVGYLLALDYAKAFDSLSKNFMLCSFDMFGFGSDFKRWVEVLTSKSQSCINHGGWLSEPFSVLCGIRQGCPFSPLAFILAVELLAVKIRNSEIQGIKVQNCQNQTQISNKIKQLADDTTLFLADKKDMEIAQDILRSFQTFSGLKLNVNKTKAMRMGREPSEDNLPFEVVNKIKILGVFFEDNKMAKNIEENWKGKIDKIQSLIVQWSKRDLSIHGKIVVTKTFLLSQIIFIMQSIGMPEIALNTINTLLYKFIWQRRHSNRRAFEKVKRVVMEADYESGGLKMINVCKLQKHFYLQWAGKLYSSTDEDNWSNIPKWHMNKLLSNKGSFFINCRGNQVPCKERIENEFWEQVLITYLENKKNIDTEETSSCNFKEQLLYFNNMIKYKNKVLYFPKWKEKGIEYMNDIIHPTERRILSLTEIENLLGYPRAATIFEYNAIKNAIPQKWMEWISNNEHNTTNAMQTMTCEASFFNAKPKQIKKILQERNPSNIFPTAKGFWQRKFNYDLDKNTWLIPKISTKEIRLQELQWKLNHNIYPTNILLHKMNVTENNKCDICKNVADFIEHFFFHCPKVSRFWENVCKIISTKIGTHFQLSETEALFGVKRDIIGKAQMLWINHILLIGKMSISIARKTNTMGALEIIFEKNVELRKNLMNANYR